MMKMILLLALGWIQSVYANDMHIIVSKSCPIESISAQEIKKIFLKKEEYLNHIFVQVLDNKEDDTYQYFVKYFLEKSPRQIKTYWLRMLFTGEKIPPEKLDIKNIKRYKKGECYMSYMYQQKDLDGWKVIQVK